MNNIAFLILAVPVATALIGWGTNWAAVKMIFYPAKFIGIGKLGWQGIVYKQSKKFAAGIADIAADNLISPQDLASRLDPEKIVALATDSASYTDREKDNEDLCRRVADIIQPQSWDNLPPHVQTMITTQTVQKSTVMAKQFLQNVQADADEIIDMHRLLRDKLSGDNAGVLAQMTQRMGRVEYKFIEYYGLFFGLVVGLIQILLWQWLEVWWSMPIVGVLVGAVTNWLAIQMIFRPQEPTKYFGLITYQGLFPKRQAEIAKDWGEMAVKKLMTAANFVELVTTGPSGQKVREKIELGISESIDKEWEAAKAMIPMDITAEQKNNIKQEIMAHLVRVGPKLQPAMETYLHQAMDIEKTVVARLTNMPKKTFERLLRGIFEEDEWTLIAVGGGLGFFVGILQALVVTSL